MTIPSAFTRLTWAGVGPLIGIVIASIALLAGTCQVAAAKSAEVPSVYALIPAQLSMGQLGLANAPAAKKRMTPPAKREGLAPEEQKRLAEAIGRLTPKQRKRLAKAVRRLTRNSAVN